MTLPTDQIDLLKMFVGACEANPAILHAPELDFYRDWLKGLGANLPPAPAWEEPKPEEAEEPPAPKPKPQAASAPPPTTESSSDSEETESEVEVNREFVTGPESEDVPELPNVEKNVTEEDSDNADDKRREAMRAMGDGDLDSTLTAFTQAIEYNPQMAALYAKRAQLFVRIGRPMAAIQDCDRALSLNTDSALAYKQRGRAYRLLGNIVQAFTDLGQGQKIDYDDDTDELQKSLKDDVHKMQEHDNRTAHLMKEKEIKNIRKRRAAAQKAHEEQQKANKQGFPGGMPGGFPGGMPGGFPGGMPGGFPGGMGGAGMAGGMGGAGMAGGMGGMPGDLGSILSDPELLQAFQDPEVSNAFMEISQNPAAAAKYKDNPKVMKLINKLKNKFGGAEGPDEPAPSASSASASSSAPTGPSESSNDLD